MRYYKSISNGYIITIGTGDGGEEISEAEYAEIESVIKNRQKTTDSTGYKLKTDLTWEAFEIEPGESDISNEEVLDIILGGTP